MKILVAISCIPDATAQISFTEDGASIAPANMPWVINPMDEYILTKAIQLKNETQARLSVVSVGGEETETILRKALAMGVDEAIRLNASPLSSMETAMEIAHFAEQELFDLLLLGKESADYNSGAVPALVAQFLQIPFVDCCADLSVSGREVTLTRLLNDSRETLKSPLPIVIAGEKELVSEKEIIIPNMRSMMQARTKTITIKPSVAVVKKQNIKFQKRATGRKGVMFSREQLGELIRIFHEEEKLI